LLFLLKLIIEITPENRFCCNSNAPALIDVGELPILYRIAVLIPGLTQQMFNSPP